MTNQKAWMFFNTETPLPKNHEYYTEEEIVEAMQKYADQQLILSGVSQQRELLIAFSECVVKEVTRKGHEEVVDYFLKKHKAINCG